MNTKTGLKLIKINLVHSALSVAGQGVKQIISHMNIGNHQNRSPPILINNKKQTTLDFPSTSKITESTESVGGIKEGKKQQTITSSILNENAMKAEIMWVLDIIMSNYSYWSCATKAKLFSKIFSDSEIAQNMKIGKTKCSYILVHGIFTHFKDILMKSLQEAPFIVISFDEPFNSVVEKGQMGLLIRYWDNDKNRVITRYFNSKFLGKAAAEDVYEKFHVLFIPR